VRLLSDNRVGHQPPVTHQDAPGREKDLPVEPAHSKLPTEDEGYQTYKAAGKLQGKYALITGGDSGIGRAIAILFAMEGATSTIAYLIEEEKDALETKRLVEAAGGTIHLYPTDLTSRQNCQKLVDTAIEKMGRINILVNNHAYQMMKKDISELSYEQWHQTFDTNIHPFFYLAKMVLPQMQRGDTIINNASINAYVGRPDLLDYTSTKGAIVSFTRGLANQKMKEGIRVNAVAPGPVWTPLVPATMDDDAQENFTSPMGRPGQPSEIATCFVFLANQDSSLISGQTLHPNGGVIVNG
jgi:NAD(P)-dependent dehydrogenase (short-subunit alcohol dehydrogenase family)